MAARARLHSTYNVVLDWKTDEGTGLLRVNFLDKNSKLPITKQRIWTDKRSIMVAVNKGVSPPKGGPRLILLQRSIEAGHGQIEIEISSDAYQKLTGKKFFIDD